MERPISELHRTLDKINMKIADMRSVNQTAWSNLHGFAIDQCWDEEAPIDLKRVQAEFFPVLEIFDELEALINHADDCYVSAVNQQKSRDLSR